jgi:prepilin-type processing-associated H-X9-DG protein
MTDGLSNTLLAGERPPSADEEFGWCYAGTGQADSGSGGMVLGVREWDYWWKTKSCWKGPYFFGPGRVENTCDTFHFWSLHPGGAHFLFADGGAHFLAYSADPVLPAPATRAGGEAAAVPD